MHAQGHHTGGSWHTLLYLFLLALIRRRTHNPYLGLGLVVVALFALIGTMIPTTPPVPWDATDRIGQQHAIQLCRQRTGLPYDTTNTSALGLNRYRGRYVQSTLAEITLCLVTSDDSVTIEHLHQSR